MLISHLSCCCLQVWDPGAEAEWDGSDGGRRAAAQRWTQTLPQRVCAAGSTQVETAAPCWRLTNWTRICFHSLISDRETDRVFSRFILLQRWNGVKYWGVFVSAIRQQLMKSFISSGFTGSPWNQLFLFIVGDYLISTSWTVEVDYSSLRCYRLF